MKTWSGDWGCEEAQITKGLRWTVIKGQKLVLVLCRTILSFSTQDRFSHVSTNFVLNFSIYARGALLPDRILASVQIFCLGNIRNIGISNSLLFFLWSSSMFALFFSGIWRRTGGRMENIRTSAKVHRGRWTQWSEIITTQTSRNSCVVGEEGERFTQLGATSCRSHVGHKWNSTTGIWRELAYSNLGPISRKTVTYRAGKAIL